MKKRIISLILVVVMSLLALSGCAYRYEEDDMINYATFDAEKFIEGLQKLAIADGENETALSFGVDEEQRWLTVEDKILKAIAAKAGDVKLTEGKVGAHDILHYSYCYTITVGEKTYVFNTDMLSQASAKVQLGLSTTAADSLEGRIEAAFADRFTFDENNAYVTNTSDTVKTEKEEAGQYVWVNVTYDLTEQKENGAASTAEKYTKVMKKVPYTVVTEGTDVTTLSFEEQLYGKNIGSSLGTITVKKDGVTYQYTNVTVNYTVKNAEPVKITGMKYELKSNEKDDTKVTDVYGKETTAGALKGHEMVYYVLPTHYIDVEEELTVETILYKIYGTSLSSSKLAIFSNDTEYKNGDEGISTLISALKTKITEYNTAETNKKNATDALNKAIAALFTGDDKQTKIDATNALLEVALAKYTEKQNATGDAVNAANEAYNTAKAELIAYAKDNGATDTTKTEFESKYDAKLAADDKFVTADKARTEAKDKVLGCLASKEAMAREIVRAYEQSEYDTLDSSYRSAVTEKVGHAIMELAQSCITYNDQYPEKALKEAIERVENELKYEFYTGTYSGSDTSLSGKTNYVAFKGSYDQYVIKGSDLGLKEDATKDDIKAAIEAKAKNSIKDVILVYVLADFLNGNNLATIGITDAEKKDIKIQLNSYSSVRESDLRVALIMDKVFTYFMATESRGEQPSKVYKPESGTSDAYELYLEQMAKYNSVNFKNVKVASYS